MFNLRESAAVCRRALRNGWTESINPGMSSEAVKGFHYRLEQHKLLGLLGPVTCSAASPSTFADARRTPRWRHRADARWGIQDADRASVAFNFIDDSCETNLEWGTAPAAGAPRRGDSPSLLPRRRLVAPTIARAAWAGSSYCQKQSPSSLSTIKVKCRGHAGRSHARLVWAPIT